MNLAIILFQACKKRAHMTICINFVYLIDRGNDNWLIKYENTPVVERTTCVDCDESDCQVCLDF